MDQFPGIEVHAMDPHPLGTSLLGLDPNVEVSELFGQEDLEVAVTTTGREDQTRVRGEDLNSAFGV